MRRSHLFAAVLVTAGAGRASAQVVRYEPNLDPDRFVLTADPRSIALTDSARPLGLLELSLGTALRFGTPPLEICVQDGTGGCANGGDVISSRVGADLVGAIGFGRVGLYAQLPIVLLQGSDLDAAGGEVSVSSVGDLRLGGKLLVIDAGRSALALDVRGLVPTGQGNGFTTDDAISLEGRAIFEHRRGKVGVALAAGYAWRREASRFANLYVDDEVLWSAAADYAVAARLRAGLAVYGRIGIMSDPDAMPGTGDPGYEERPIEALGSARYGLTRELALEAAAGGDLVDGYGPAFRALLGVRWSPAKAPAELDWDHDRIPNTTDECPTKPEDWDGFADEDGCPELDNDKDKIPDRSDRCPLDPEDYDGFEDKEGCPDPDNDGDRILDPADKCPNEAEDLDGFADDDGCPDADNDADGVLDLSDKCPNNAEDKDGFEDADGCPELDNDGDGLVDTADKCPIEPETYNGTDDADGCPDAAPTVVVTPTKVEIKETIYFDYNKATIKPISFKLLDGVAAALTAHQDLLISIEGHTDDRGNDAYNMNLSQRRAEAVRAYLIAKGIDGARLTATGYGESRPAVAGTSTAARDQNRRVEFIIVNQGPRQPPGSGSSPLPAAPPAAPPTP